MVFVFRKKTYSRVKTLKECSRFCSELRATKFAEDGKESWIKSFQTTKAKVKKLLRWQNYKCKKINVTDVLKTCLLYNFEFGESSKFEFVWSDKDEHKYAKFLIQNITSERNV